MRGSPPPQLSCHEELLLFYDGASLVELSTGVVVFVTACGWLCALSCYSANQFVGSLHPRIAACITQDKAKLIRVMMLANSGQRPSYSDDGTADGFPPCLLAVVNVTTGLDGAISEF